MHALIADKFEPSGVAGLKSLGLQVTVNADLSPETLPGAIADLDPDILIVRSTKVQAPAFERARKLSLVIRAGAGFDNIDLAAASSRGISVATCPGKNSIAVAELTWGLILACDRRIPEQTAELKAAQWNKKEYSKARGLHGRTLGVIGLGRIAEEVIARAHAFGMEVIAWSRSLTDARARELGVLRAPDTLTVARESDVVSVNIAANSETKGLLNAAFCEALRPGAIFINTSRGAVVDEGALLNAVRSKGVRCGLDVFTNEPGAATGAFDSAIAKSPGVCGTHHIGASTDQAQQAIAEEVVRIVRDYKTTGEAPNVINLCDKTPATRLLVVRHLNKPGVLAHVVGAIGKAGINIEDMDNVIYQGATAACARISLDADPGAEVMNAIRTGSPHVLSVDLTVIE
ncbi:MAG TPA: hydroxyacid dehydrogenase [Phycisphaerales bacterium]|nr:hydroxyacid dehydrogenase [Phycisphaerales bacterium]